jgi:hypothetical protein
MGEPETPEDSDWSEPTASAKVTVEKTMLGARAEFPANPPARLIEFVVYASACVGAVLGPALTINAVPENAPLGATTATLLGQLGVLLVVVLATRFRADARRAKR